MSAAELPHRLSQVVGALPARLFVRSVHTAVSAVQQARWVPVRQSTPYVLTFLGLVGGLVVLLFAPLPSATLNSLVGGAFLAVAVASVTAMIAEYSGPDERGPDF